MKQKTKGFIALGAVGLLLIAALVTVAVIRKQAAETEAKDVVQVTVQDQEEIVTGPADTDVAESLPILSIEPAEETGGEDADDHSVASEETPEKPAQSEDTAGTDNSSQEKAPGADNSTQTGSSTENGNPSGPVIPTAPNEPSDAGENQDTPIELPFVPAL